MSLTPYRPYTIDHPQPGGDALKFRLICFDVDGTLVEKWTDQLLPGVETFFTDYYIPLYMDSPVTRPHPAPHIALVTNQGGVGLRYWMETKDFGEPEKFPTKRSVQDRLDSISKQLGIWQHVTFHKSFAFQSKTGEWGPTPYDPKDTSLGMKTPTAWRPDRRKPAPGMIVDAMAAHGVSSKNDVLMVGDRPEDQGAAQAAGVGFIWADNFFNR